MKKDHYIGVDISKKTIDVAIYVKNPTDKFPIPHETFQNGNDGFKEMNRWLRSKGVAISKYWCPVKLFCVPKIKVGFLAWNPTFFVTFVFVTKPK